MLPTAITLPLLPVRLSIYLPSYISSFIYWLSNIQQAKVFHLKLSSLLIMLFTKRPYGDVG